MDVLLGAGILLIGIIIGFGLGSIGAGGPQE